MIRPKGWAPRPAKVIEGYTARPRTPPPRVAPSGSVTSVAKFAYIRDTRFRDVCRDMACQHCGRAGEDAGVTWAHSNQAAHGHGRGVKASDQFVAALCWVCHRELDQGKLWTQEEKVRIWTDAHLSTVRLALATGTWPSGVDPPTR